MTLVVADYDEAIDFYTKKLNFDNFLCGWSLLPSVQPSLTIDFGTAVYTTAIAQPCYDILDLAPNNWTINSNGGV